MKSTIGNTVSKINYTPRTKCVLVKDSKEQGIIANSKLITPDKISDADSLRFGGVSKSAALANKTSEDQSRYTIIKVGSKVEEYVVGDEVIFQGGAQGHSIMIGEEYYLQLGEYDILGKFN